MVHGVSWLAETARERPGAPALRAGDITLDYAGLAERAARGAGALAAAGVAPGDRVAVRLPNRLDHAVAIHAVAWRGAVLVPVHRRWEAREVPEPVARVRAKLLVSDPDDPVAGADLPCPVLHAGALHEGVPMDPVPRADHALHSILFTSGTTGTPRAVPLTHGNHRASAGASAANLGVEPDDDWLCCLPLSHVGGLAILLRSVLQGTTATLVEGFEAEAVAAHLGSGRISVASLVPTMLRRLLEIGPPPDPGGDELRPYTQRVEVHQTGGVEQLASARAGGTPKPVPGSRLRAVLLGGGPFDRALVERALDHGLPVLGTYGMTETASQVATVPPEAARRKAGSGGRALSGVKLEVLGDDGRPAGPGESGAIRVRGAMVAASAAGPDGWLTTGDRGHLDGDGFLWVAGRADAVIVTGGENVAPAEVEAALREHPEVADCAVVGVPDPVWGRAVAAAVVPRHPGSPPAPDDLTAWCRARLAGFKVPRRWAIVADLPRTPSGKVATAALPNLFE